MLCKKKRRKEISGSVPGIPHDTLLRPSQDPFTARYTGGNGE